MKRMGEKNFLKRMGKRGTYLGTLPPEVDFLSWSVSWQRCRGVQVLLHFIPGLQKRVLLVIGWQRSGDLHTGL